MIAFDAELFRYPGPSGWTFVVVPAADAPEPTRPWGRTPVVATVDGLTYATSVWRGRDGRTLLSIPARIRRGKDAGDGVRVALTVDDR
ncbi:MAG: DUF1905 domain-containing protein [Myxococcota bacterium]